MIRVVLRRVWDPGDGAAHPHRGGELRRVLHGAEAAGGERGQAAGGGGGAGERGQGRQVRGGAAGQAAAVTAAAGQGWGRGGVEGTSEIFVRYALPCWILFTI